MVSRPITNLVDVAKRVSENRDYSLRVDETLDSDLGILTEEFNDMLGQIKGAMPICSRRSVSASGPNPLYRGPTPS